MNEPDTLLSCDILILDPPSHLVDESFYFRKTQLSFKGNPTPKENQFKPDQIQVCSKK